MSKKRRPYQNFELVHPNFSLPHMESGDFFLRREALGQIVLLSSEVPTMEQDSITVPRVARSSQVSVM
jgi:hypothetical protein